MNKETLAKWEERAKPEGLHRLAFLKGINEYREALRVLVEAMPAHITNEKLMKRQFLYFLETVEPLPLPPVDDSTPFRDDEGYF